jgi:hypothetical protein
MTVTSILGGLASVRQWWAWSLLLRWLGCTVLFSTAPILWNLWGRYLDGREITLTALLEHGELFLIACPLAAAGLGEVLGARLTAWPLLAAIGCAVSVAGTAWAYSHLQAPGYHAPQATVHSSIVSFTVTLFASTVCVIISRNPDRI